MKQLFEKTCAVAALSLMLCSGAAYADGVGYVGLSFGSNDGSNPNDAEQERAYSATLDAAYAFGIGANQTLVVEGSYRADHYGTVILNREIEDQLQIGVHYLFDIAGGSAQSFGGGLKLGGFASYGSAPHVDGTPDETYKVVLAGLEVIYSPNWFGDSLTIFGQIGLGDAVGQGSNNSSDGFNDGTFGRLGVSYSGIKNTTLTLEGEVARSKSYEDSDEPGDFSAYRISGVTQLPFKANLAVTYGMNFGIYDAENDPDYIKETSFNLGLRYTFGKRATRNSTNLARAGIIGLPTLPLRASVFTPGLD
jgi:hypothetical protein